MTTRRMFIQQSVGTAGGLVAGSLLLPSASATQLSSPTSLKGRLYKTLKIGMIDVPGQLTDRFSAAKEAGFHGVEIETPGLDVSAANEAIKKSGLPVDGAVISNHWVVRHTDPSSDVRRKALEALKRSLEETHLVGGNTVLLVAGHGKDGSQADIWKRGVDNISQAIPLAAELGVFIAIENVWNHFMYDHAGDCNQTAAKYVEFIDELNSPWVGMQFDIGNHWKYGSMGDWIRQLGKRIVKLDLKGFSRVEDRFADIGQGDLDWGDVRKALLEINFTGWAAAEVGKGDPVRLRKISSQMDQVFGLLDA
ncbi:MAG: sugar phosphate isomerase/epimerase [Fuerstiella sp.]|nr:sugar phosphate isomerase/epimerase [Fuerstiella sp.]